MNLTHLFTRSFHRRSTIPQLTFKALMKANGYHFMYNYSLEHSLENAKKVIDEYGYDYVLGPAYTHGTNVYMDRYCSLYVKLPKDLAAELKEELNFT